MRSSIFLLWAYVIFHRDTGQIVHVHIEPDEVATSRETLLAFVDREHAREALEIVVADAGQMRAGISGYVDPATKQLKPADKEGISFAGGLAGANAVPELPASVRRVYQREQQRSH
jgi:hypothetical protein